MKSLATFTLAGVLAAATVACQKHTHDEAYITMNEVPQKVRDAFRTAYPNATVNEIEREVHGDGSTHYEFKFAGADGKTKEVEFDKDGRELADH